MKVHVEHFVPGRHSAIWFLLTALGFDDDNDDGKNEGMKWRWQDFNLGARRSVWVSEGASTRLNPGPLYKIQINANCSSVTVKKRKKSCKRMKNENEKCRGKKDFGTIKARSRL